MSRMRTHRHTVAIVVGAAVILATVVVFLGWTLRLIGTPSLWNLETYVDPRNAADRAALLQAQIQAIAVLVQVLGGLFLVGALYTAVRTMQLTQRSLELSREQLIIAYDGQITERFTRAIEQLGASFDDARPRLEVRLGGIYALERIAKNSLPDNGPIMEVLTAYVRENARALAQDDPRSRPEANGLLNPKPPADIQAILTIIGRRSEEQRELMKDPLDLSRTNLRGANLIGAHLEHAILVLSRLEGANLKGNHLQASSLGGANLEEATLTLAHLDDADLTMANLSGSFLSQAHLESAKLNGANLKGADLRDTHLEGAHLMDVVGLTQEQIDSTFMDEQTQLPRNPGPDGQPFQRSGRRDGSTYSESRNGRHLPTW